MLKLKYNASDNPSKNSTFTGLRILFLYCDITMKNINRSLIVAAFVLPFFMSCSKPADNNSTTGSADTAVLQPAMEGEGPGDMMDSSKAAMSDGFDNVTFDMPEMRMDNYEGNSISYRSSDAASMYSLGENILFETEKAEISTKGATELKSIADNIKKNFNGGQVKIYGFTDETGNAKFNKELSDMRAKSVMQYLVGNTDISADRITTYAKGEKGAMAVGENSQERKVVIVAKR
jgi:outer membrane protein OmpA-like peptidoglycan-associated protein